MTQSTQHLLQGDLLSQRIIENQLYSPLARLPDHVLVNIMSSCDLESLARLRHTSRIFMILFSVNPAFKSLHLTSDDDPRFRDTARLWEVPRSIIPTHQEVIFLETQRMCQSCLTRRKGDRLGRTLLSSMPLLYCSGCRTTHREMHFSARMRSATDSDRLCVGHEGHLIICRHRVLSLQQAKLDAASGAKNQPCPFVHDTTRPTCDSNTCPADNRPQVHAYCNEHGKLRIKISHTCHIKAQRLPNGKMCPSSLRKELIRTSRYRDLGVWNIMLCKTAYDEMQAFDPNICDCVDYYRDIPSLQRQRPIRVCPAPAVARWQEKAPEGGYVSETGRCAYMRHGYTVDGVGIQLRVDFLRCHGASSDMLAMRKTLDGALDPAAAASAGWADLVSWGSFDTILDKQHRGLFFCQRQDCAVTYLQAFDVHLRAIETRQIQREKLAGTATKMIQQGQGGGGEGDDPGHHEG